ncbi:hypothetical protein DENSPDRAFT_839898 [Dentipellis sp. KUC8613]|nr:hypothetical protein DENSPDRAFT_839898 [Dentipellis sp. KUC8613]
MGLLRCFGATSSLTSSLVIFPWLRRCVISMKRSRRPSPDGYSFFCTSAYAIVRGVPTRTALSPTYGIRGKEELCLKSFGTIAC